MRRPACFCLLLALSAAGCHGDGLPQGTADLAAPPDLGAQPDLVFGRCFGFALPKGIVCTSTRWDCRPSPYLPNSCQEGMCCSGVLDPGTCICRCNGVVCPDSAPACCAGMPAAKNRSRRTPPDLGVVMCRPPPDCQPGGPPS